VAERAPGLFQPRTCIRLFTNGLTLECIRGLILSMVKNRSLTVLHSGALAKATGVSPDTIRHYEEIGVLPRASRTHSGYRVYTASAVERVLVIRRALRLGFTLAELGEVLKARDAGGAPCRHVYKLAQEKLKGITADIEALKQTQEYLGKVLGEWEHRMRQTAPGQKSNLLHSLTGAVNGSSSKTQFRRKRT
jgi:DNA-binding transcriptional MerR regulator